MPNAKSSTKQTAGVVKAVIIDEVDQPQKSTPAKTIAMKADLNVTYATCDALIQNLASQTCLGTYLGWEYAINSNTPIRATLENAVFGLMDVNFNCPGQLRKRTINDMISSYWNLHSKYIAPNGYEVNVMYTEVLNHFMNIYNQYGDDFLKSNSRVEQDFIDALAREAVPPDESEKVAANGVYDMLQGFKTKNGMASLVDMWLTKYAVIPSRTGPLKLRVNMDLNEKVYFRYDGVLGVAIRIIREFIERLRSPELPQKDNKQPMRDFIDWQMGYQTNFKMFKSCILLACPCILPQQKVTQLQPDFWQHKGIQTILTEMAAEKKHPAADAISALFIYSGIDPSHGIDALLEYQRNNLHESDKPTGFIAAQPNYHYVVNEHKRMRGPPWRTKNAAWPEGAVMENSNYAHARVIIDAVLVPHGPIRSAIIPEEKSQTPFLFKEAKKTTLKVAPTPKEEEVPEAEPQSSVPWGPLIAVTAGIGALGAVYMSGGPKRK